jgi:hypothetical protein
LVLDSCTSAVFNENGGCSAVLPGLDPGGGVLSKIKRSIGALAAMAIAATFVMSGSALAAPRPTAKTKAQWRADIARVRQPGSGCYHATYPVLRWRAVKCVAAPKVPLVPAPLSRSARHGGPDTVGDGTDYSAVVSGLISKATGTFQGVSSGITEEGQAGGSGSQVANAFSLQPESVKSNETSGCLRGLW